MNHFEYFINVKNKELYKNVSTKIFVNEAVHCFNLQHCKPPIDGLDGLHGEFEMELSKEITNYKLVWQLV